jgi:hypothetical protein
VVVVEGHREVKREIAELYIPEPGRRVYYLGNVVKVERFIPRVKAFRVNGVDRYGAVQILLPKDCIGKPVYAIVYVIVDELGSEVIDESKFRLRRGTPLLKVI